MNLHRLKIDQGNKRVMEYQGGEEGFSKQGAKESIKRKSWQIQKENWTPRSRAICRRAVERKRKQS